jgi:hypothetical protein
MADRANKPPRKRLGFFDARDRVMNLNMAYRGRILTGADDKALKRQHDELAEFEIPEPDVELEGAELSDAERREAMARERLRRERNNDR